MPVIGPPLYRLNVSRPVIRHMAAGHVYAVRGWLTEDRLRQKLAVTRSPGARHASVRFVTGALDPFASRDEFLSAARACALPDSGCLRGRNPAALEGRDRGPGGRSREPS